MALQDLHGAAEFKRSDYRLCIGGCGGLARTNSKSGLCRICYLGFIRTRIPDQLTCAWPPCSKAFKPKPRAKNRSGPGWNIYCSKTCSYQANTNLHNAIPRLPPGEAEARYKARSLAKSRKRRARINAVAWDGITDKAILERDQWRCQTPTCLYRSRRIDPARRNPDPRSASVDHILPLSLGGDDTQWNKRAAHLRCNRARSDQLDDQMPLALGSHGA